MGFLRHSAKSSDLKQNEFPKVFCCVWSLILSLKVPRRKIQNELSQLSCFLKYFSSESYLKKSIVVSWGTYLFTKAKLCTFSLFVCLGSSRVWRGPCFFAWNNIGRQARALSLSIQTNIKKLAGNIIIGQLIFSLSPHKELLNVVSAHPNWRKCWFMDKIRISLSCQEHKSFESTTF